MYKSQILKLTLMTGFVVQGPIWFSKAVVMITFIYLLDYV